MNYFIFPYINISLQGLHINNLRQTLLRTTQEHIQMQQTFLMESFLEMQKR